MARKRPWLEAFLERKRKEYEENPTKKRRFVNTGYDERSARNNRWTPACKEEKLLAKIYGMKASDFGLFIRVYCMGWEADQVFRKNRSFVNRHETTAGHPFMQSFDSTCLICSSTINQHSDKVFYLRWCGKDWVKSVCSTQCEILAVDWAVQTIEMVHRKKKYDLRYKNGSGNKWLPICVHPALHKKNWNEKKEMWKWKSDIDIICQ